MDNSETQTTLEDFGDATLVVRIRKSKKDRQHNGQKKKDKKTNNDLENTSQKTEDRANEPTNKRRWTQVLWNGKQLETGQINKTKQKQNTKKNFKKKEKKEKKRKKKKKG